MSTTIPAGEVARPHLCKLEIKTDGAWSTEQPGVSLLYPGKWLARMTANGKTPRLTITHADGTAEVLTSGMSCSCHPQQAADLELINPRDPVQVCPFCDEQHGEPHDGTCLL